MEHETSPSGADSTEQRRKQRHRAVPLLTEVRYFKATGLEVRSVAKTDDITISGSPVVYSTDYEVLDAFGPFTERMAPGVATEVLARGADVRFLFNHDGLPLARSTSGTLTLEDSATELRFTARLDARQQLANDLAIAIERGDVSQMSCGFCVARDEWDEAMEDRTILQFAELLDVSAVTYPASPTTSIEVAQRMALAIPVESRARLRRFYLDGRAGKTLAPERFEALRSMLDPGEDLETPEGTGPLGHPDGDGGTWSDPGDSVPGDGTVGAGSTDQGIEDGTGTREADGTAVEQREPEPSTQTSRATRLRVKRALRGI